MTRRILALGHVGPAFTSSASAGGSRNGAEEVVMNHAPGQATYHLTGDDIPSPISEVPSPSQAGGSSGRAWGRAGEGISPSKEAS